MSIRLLLAAAVLASGIARAAESPSDFAFALAIEGVGSDALYRLGIPQEVYESAAFADLRDIRVFNGAGQVVPHAFLPAAPSARRPASVALPFFPLRGPRGSDANDLDLALESTGGRTSLRVKLRDSRPEPAVLLGYLVDVSAREETLSALQLDWNATPAGYVSSLRVEASEDLKHWTTMADHAPIMSLTHGGHRLEQKTVAFGPRRVKYLRLTWPQEAVAPEFTAVMGLPVEESAPPARAWKEVTAMPDPRRSGDYLVDLGGVFPVDRLAIRLPQENAIAPVQILSRDESTDEWRPLARTVAYRLRQGAVEMVSPELVVPATAHRQWLLRVDQKGGGVGEGGILVKAGWISREIVFAARGAGPFLLAFGNGKAQANALAIRTLVPGWGGDSAPEIARAAAGASQTLAGESAGRRRIDMKKASLWAALFVGVAFLGFMAWRLAKQMK
jgi:hypothetical protein